MVYKYLDASTCYVTEAEAHDFASAPCFLADYTYGAFFYVPEEIEESGHEFSWEDYPNLKAVIAYAKSLGCQVVRLDADADDDLPLPTFNW